MRLIDADALIEDIKTKLWDWDTVDGITPSTVLKQTITDIDNAPTIDAVPVVRRKDCKHWQPSEYGVVEQPYCKHLGYKEETGLDIQIGNENDFCSFGERKDNEH